jgi:hypothetical protein
MPISISCFLRKPTNSMLAIPQSEPRNAQENTIQITRALQGDIKIGPWSIKKLFHLNSWPMPGSEKWNRGKVDCEFKNSLMVQSIPPLRREGRGYEPLSSHTENEAVTKSNGFFLWIRFTQKHTQLFYKGNAFYFSGDWDLNLSLNFKTEFILCYSS